MPAKQDGNAGLKDSERLVVVGRMSSLAECAIDKGHYAE